MSIFGFVKGVTKASIKTALVPLEVAADVIKNDDFENSAELIEEAGNDLNDAFESLFGSQEDGVDEV